MEKSVGTAEQSRGASLRQAPPGAVKSDGRTYWSDAATLLRAGAAIPLVLAFCITIADADLWGHVRFGRDIAAAHEVPRQDPYSFTSDRPWVNHEWLAELTMYGAYAAAGPQGLMILKIALALATITLIAWELRRDRPPAVLRDVLLVLAWFALYRRYSAVRPQIFSVALFTLVLVILREADRGRRAGLFLLPAIVLPWSNLHGGWIVGLAAIEIWIGLEVLERGLTSRDRVTLLGIGAEAAAASLVNPYGLGLWKFLWHTVGLSRPDITEWRPLGSIPENLPWYFALALGLASIIVRGLPRRRGYLAITLIIGFASWRVSRNDVFFVLSVVLLVVAPAASGWTAVRRATRMQFSVGSDDGRRMAVRGAHSAPARERGGAQGSPRATEPGSGAEPRFSWTWPPRPRVAVPGARVVRAAMAVLVLVEAIVLAPGYIVAMKCLEVGIARIAPLPGAARFVKLNHLQGRMITYFDWGEYAIWHFSPDIRVSFDGRRETVYSDRLIAEHRELFWGRPGGMDLVRRLNPDYIWLRSDLDVIPLLDRADWRRIYSDRTSIIFARPTTRHFEQPAPEPPSRTLRCFPSE